MASSPCHRAHSWTLSSPDHLTSRPGPLTPAGLFPVPYRVLCACACGWAWPRAPAHTGIWASAKCPAGPHGYSLAPMCAGSHLSAVACAYLRPITDAFTRRTLKTRLAAPGEEWWVVSVAVATGTRDAGVCSMTWPIGSAIAVNGFYRWQKKRVLPKDKRLDLHVGSVMANGTLFLCTGTSALCGEVAVLSQVQSTFNDLVSITLGVVHLDFLPTSFGLSISVRGEGRQNSNAMTPCTLFAG